MWRFTLFTITLISFSKCENILFPENETATTTLQFAPMPLASQPIIQKRTYFGTKSSYNKYVDDIIAQGVTNLCLAIDRTVANSNANANNDYTVYSPLSIASALSLVLLGAHGKTFEELSTLLGLAHGVNIANNPLAVHEEFGDLIQTLENSEPKDTQTISFANGVFIQNDFPIREQYRVASNSVYKSEVMNLDFQENPSAAKNVINNWVSAKTFGKIDQIMPMDPSTETKVVLVSSLYFKAEWDNPFGTSLTKISPFYPNGKDQPSTIKTNLMVNGGEYPYHNDSLLNCQIVGLPYKGKTTTFYFVTPHNSNPQKLRELENRLTASEIKRLVGSTTKTPIIVALPKMKLTTTLQLQKPLHSLGLKSLFDPRESNLALLSPGINGIKNRNEQLVARPLNDEPFVFATRMGEMPQIQMRKKRQLNDATRILSARDYENNLDTIRHKLNADKDQSNPGLYADMIIHKVFVDVNEKGTEAAAATGVSLSRDGSRIVVKADVPFFFFIYHEETNMVLFWGSVNTPSPNFQ